MMNRKFGWYSTAANLMCVAAFALSMLFGVPFASYFSSVGIAISFVAMTGALAACAGKSARAPAYCALAFAAMYALCNLLVYFTQLATVRAGGLSADWMRQLDFQQYGMLFHWDMLGYALMSFSTFMIAWAIEPRGKTGVWLRRLLRVHGVFAVTCFAAPMLPVFQGGSGAGQGLGVLLLEFWCIYFAAVDLCALGHFRAGDELESNR